jgi:hypothetical protein
MLRIESVESAIATKGEHRQCALDRCSEGIFYCMSELVGVNAEKKSVESAITFAKSTLV